MSSYVYILLCDEKTYYVGVTNDINKRILEHKSKQSFFTKKFSNIDLVYFEKFETLVLARKREKQLKGWSSAKKKALTQNDKILLRKLSKSTGFVEELQG